MLSGIGISIGTASLIICLSVFNGFQNLIIERYNAIYPDYIIKPLKSKYLNNPDDIILNVKELDNQLVCTKVIEENAYIKYDESEFILKILGVDSIFSRYSKLSKYLSSEFKEEEIRLDRIIISESAASALDLNNGNPIYPIQILIPKLGKGSISINPQNAFVTDYVQPGQQFSINPEVDQSVGFLEIHLLNNLVNVLPKASCIYIYSSSLSSKNLKELKVLLSTSFNAKIVSRIEQNQSLYRILNIERLALILIVAFIVFIISFSLFGSISILAIEKRQNFSTLMSLGFSDSDIYKILLLLASAIITTAIFFGNILGFIVCTVQQKFGIVKLGGLNTFIIDAYPVKFSFIDVLNTDIIVFLVSFISILPLKRIQFIKIM